MQRSAGITAHRCCPKRLVFRQVTIPGRPQVDLATHRIT
jgi:hypothetical protein